MQRIYAHPAFTKLVAFAAMGLPAVLSAQMATQPLLTRSIAAYPNLVFMYDDSASMADTYVYQYGGTAGVNGLTGPGGTESALAPEVNRMYYNPRIAYKLRVDAAGTNIAISTLGNSTTFNVYFYKKAAGNTVSSIWDNTGNSASAGASYFKVGSPAGYQPAASELATGASATTKYPNAASSTVASYPKWSGRTDCTTSTTVCTWAEELRNYSVWSANHNTRDKLAKTGIGLAFKDIGATVRIGWGRINTLDGGTLDSGVTLFNQTAKNNFYTWLYGINSNVASTPNRLALDSVGKYYSRTDSDGPWGTTPRAASTGSTTIASPVSTEARASHLSCRRSFAMLMTDGYYNDTNPTVGNVDGANGPIMTSPSGSSYQYKPSTSPLYKDNNSNSFADVAMKYWVNDLRTDLANNVPSSTANESFWQNMTFYAIGLGVIGNLAQTQATMNSIASGAISWPAPAPNASGAIDDMWHATLNGRGAMLTATDSQTLNDSVDMMMASINRVTSSQSGVAVSTASLKTGTRKYTPQYTTGTWKGNVVARTLDPDTGNETGTAWQVQDTDSTGVTYNRIPAASARNIVVGTAATSGARAVPFTLTDMTTANLINDMPAAARTANMVNYLRGDATNEAPTGIYRTRANRLGDIVNSAPVFIKETPARELVDPMNSSSKKVLEATTTSTPLPGSGSSYTTYLATLAARPEGVVIVGANDGMLHAFRDGTTASPSIGGNEIFAYVPRTALATMDKLSDPAYNHLYFVDGPNIESDAYLNSSWKQVVVGTMGAGGKTVYALDVTDPLALGASKVLWEINASSTGFANLGYSLSDVQTGALINDTWAALFGNGYESTSGTASLMVVNLQTGALIRELQTPAATGGPWSATVSGTTTNYKNGLSGVRLVRDSSEQRVVGAYAGDLRGNVWRFDLSDPTPSNWTVTQMFSTGSVTPSVTVPTGYPKPITATPQWVVNPAGGRVLIVGTGKFYQDSDLPAPYSTQTIFGLADKTAFGTTPSSALPLSSSALEQRVLSTVAANSSYLQLTDSGGGAPGLIDWAQKSGWYIDLPFSGQRLTYPMEKLINRNSRVLVIDTISPSNVSLDACIQTGSGAGWTMFLDGLYGADPGRAPDLSPSEFSSVLLVPNSTSSYAMGVATAADGRNTTLKIDSRSTSSVTRFTTLSGGSSSGLETNINCKILGTCSPPPNCTTNPTDPACLSFCATHPTDPTCTTGTGPKTIKSREWRQIFMR
ncbi:MAG: PilC/PilY family type IV pilus protein [Rhodoferax sp.]|nr:PilC/PilY family type IV pilus protein [Rhodoferax sp.]